MSKRGLDDVNVAGTLVLVRVDFNVPIEQGIDGLAHYTHRLKASMPTIEHLIKEGARTIICSHLGRPKGKVVEGLRMAPVGEQLSILMGVDVVCLDDSIGPAVEDAVSSMSSGDVLLLENLRFHPGEEANDPDYSQSLASLADIFVMDAFAVAHRAHASTVGVPQLLPTAAGKLMQREVEMLGKVLGSPDRPLAALLGGAKVEDKIRVLDNLLTRVDRLFIGGGMSNAFLQAQGYGTGASRAEEEDVGFAQSILEKAGSRGIHVNFPTDVVVSDKFGADAQDVKTVPVDRVPDNWHVMDIGPATTEAFSGSLEECKTVVWNGPMGVFEYAAFSQGTRTIASALASSGGVVIVGGGSTAEVVEEMGLQENMAHVSTGGGASLEFLEGKDLPGLAAIPDAQLKGKP